MFEALSYYENGLIYLAIGFYILCLSIITISSWYSMKVVYKLPEPFWKNHLTNKIFLMYSVFNLFLISGGFYLIYYIHQLKKTLI